MSLLLSDFYPKADAVLITGNQTITGVKTFNERIVAPEIRGLGLGGVNKKIDLQEGHLYAGSTTISLDYWNRILSGDWKFQNRPTVSGIGVLLQGEAAGGGGTVENAVYTTGTQTITGPKNFTARPTLSGLNLITTGDLVDLELNIEGALASSSAFNGNRPIKAVPVNNTNYGGTTISGFLENMFFPHLDSTLTLTNFDNIFTYGVNSFTSISYIGNITKNDDTITGIAYRSGDLILSGPTVRTTDGSYSTVPIPFSSSIRESTNLIFNTQLFVQKNGVSETRLSPYKRLRFEPRYFYGVSNNTNLGTSITTLTPSNVSQYTYAFGSKPSSVTHAGFAPNNQYIYFAYPSPESTQDNIINWGNSLSSIKDVNSNFEYINTYQQLTPVVIAYPLAGKTLRYRIYRSNDLITLLPGQSLSLQFVLGS